MLRKIKDLYFKAMSNDLLQKACRWNKLLEYALFELKPGKEIFHPYGDRQNVTLELIQN